jgi:hypothetical protein
MEILLRLKSSAQTLINKLKQFLKVGEKKNPNAKSPNKGWRLNRWGFPTLNK